jgi:hypothetical protein
MVAWIRGDPKTYRLLARHAQSIMNKWPSARIYYSEHAPHAPSGLTPGGGEILLDVVLWDIEAGRVAKSWHPGSPSVPREVGSAVRWIKNKVRDKAKDAIRRSERHRKGPRKGGVVLLSLDYDMGHTSEPFTFKETLPCDADGRHMPEPAHITRGQRPGHYKSVAGRIEDRLIAGIDRRRAVEQTRDVLLTITRSNPKVEAILTDYENQLRRIVCGAGEDFVPPLKTADFFKLTDEELDAHIDRASEETRRSVILRLRVLGDMAVNEVSAQGFDDGAVKAVDRAYRNAVPDAHRAGFRAWFSLVCGMES